jgi:hypothetical protein
MHSGSGDVVGALCWRELVKREADGLPKCPEGSRGRFTQETFELGECQLDRISGPGCMEEGRAASAHSLDRLVRATQPCAN